MLYKKLYLKISGVNHYSLLLMRFLNEGLNAYLFTLFFAKTLKSVLVGTLKSTVKKLSVSKAGIFSISVGI